MSEAAAKETKEQKLADDQKTAHDETKQDHIHTVDTESKADDDEDDKDEDEEELILYRSLNVDELEEECETLQLSTQGFLLLPRLLKEGVAAASKLQDYLRVKSLLAAKASADSHGTTDKPPVVWAATNGNIRLVKLLVTEGGANFDAKARFGIRALTVAARRNDTELCKFLISEGASVNAVADNGYAALTWAAANGFEDLTELLLEHEAEPTVATTPAGLTPLHLACQWGHQKVG